MKAKRFIAVFLSLVLCTALIPESMVSAVFGDISGKAYAESSDDPYFSTYGITEEQLFTTYPDYLSESFVLDKLHEYNREVIRLGNSGDTSMNTILYSIGNGLSLLSTEVVAALGLGESTEEQVCDAVVLKIAQEMTSDPAVSLSYLKKNYSLFKDIKGAVWDLAKLVDQQKLADMLSKIDGLSKDKASSLVKDGFEGFSTIKSGVNIGVEVSDLIIQAAEFEAVDSQILYDIFFYFQLNNQPELADAAWRLYQRSEMDFGERMFDIYLTDKCADLFADLIKETFMPSKATIIVKIGYKVLEKLNIVHDIKDILGANYSSIAASSSYYYMQKLLETSKTQMLSESDIRDFEFAYSLCTASLKTGFGYAEKCADSKELRMEASTDKAIVGVFTYENYIKGCMSLYKAAKENNELKTASYADGGSKKVSTTITPEKSYENILERFQKIQSVYPPNAGVQYLVGGECYGFAKMVFKNLFGVAMPSCYRGSEKYEYSSSENVEKVGQLTGADVTVANLESLFSKAKLGDIIQACGKDFEQHTMVFVNYSSSGLTLYDCNFRYTDAAVEEYGSCFVHQRTYTLSEFAGWYDNVGTYDVANGVTVYHATNYEYIYGGEDVIFYDDSVNFVISDGVLTKYNGSQRYVEIPAEVTAIGADAFKNNDSMISVVIPDGVTSIGASAFYDCDSLAAVVMPDSVETIGSQCFYSCDNLGYVYISNKITTIPENVFAYCQKLDNVNLPEKLKSIGLAAFYNCDSLSGIVIPASLTQTDYDDFDLALYRGTGAFSNCDNLTTVTFEEGATTVPSYLFINCTGLETVFFPDTISYIGLDAFNNCKKLTNVDLPPYLDTISDFAFSNCPQITKITVPKSLKNYNNRYPGLTNYDNTCTAFGSGCTNLTRIVFEEGTPEVIPFIFARTPIKELTIPDCISSIGKYAFYGCEQLEVVTLSKSLLTIGNHAFSNCEKLSEITIPKSTSTIGSYAFSNSGLTSVVIPTATTVISDVFYNCTSLSTVSISKRTTDISGAFENCTALESISLPATIADISDAFKNCTSLESLSLPASITSASLAFSGSGLKNVTFEEGFSSIPSGIFNNADMLESITIPDTVTKIESSAFYDCDALTEIVVPDSVQSIGTSAFSSCDELNKAVLGNGITSLATQTFYNDAKLSTVVLPQNLKTIANEVFYNCDSLKTIDIPDSVYSIGSKAFYDCDALESVSLKNVSTISSEAFRDCDSLASVYLGDYVGTIGASAFRKLPKLTSITIPSPVATIADYAFAENVTLADVHIPSSAVTISDTAFSYPDIMTVHAAEGSAAAEYAEYWEFEFAADDYDLSIVPTVSDIMPNSFAVSWQPAAGIEKYSVSYLDNNNIFTTAAEDIIGSSYVVTGLKPYTSYKVLVRGFKNGRYSDYTTADFVSVKTAQAAGDITTLTAEPAETTVALSWTFSSSANGYIVYQLDSLGGWNEIARTTSSVRTYNVTGLMAGTDYTFAVCGYRNINSEAVPGNKTEASTKTLGSKQLVNCVGHSLILTDSIGIKYYIELADEIKNDPDAYVEFTLPNGNCEKIYMGEANSVTLNGKSALEFSCYVSAAEMTDVISSRVVLGSGESVSLNDYTVQTYAKYILGNADNNAQYAQAAPVVKAMLNYGAYSQIIFNHSIDNLANSCVTDKMPSNVTSEGLSRYKYSVTDSDTDIDFVGQLISLNSKVNAKLYFTSASGKTLSKEQFAVKQKGVTINNARITVESDKIGQYIKISDICAGDFDEAFDISVGGVTISNFSVYSYLKQALDSTDINLVNVARSIYDYNVAVETYAA